MNQVRFIWPVALPSPDLLGHSQRRKPLTSVRISPHRSIYFQLCRIPTACQARHAWLLPEGGVTKLSEGGVQRKPERAANEMEMRASGGCSAIDPSAQHSCHGANLGRVPSPAAAFLVFLPAPAGAGIISANIRFSLNNGRMIRTSHPRFGAESFRVQQIFHITNVFRLVWFQTSNEFPVVVLADGGNFHQPFFCLDSKYHGILFCAEFCHCFVLLTFWSVGPIAEAG